MCSSGQGSWGGNPPSIGTSGHRIIGSSGDLPNKNFFGYLPHELWPTRSKTLAITS
jgi:hypothetical protein